MTFYASSEGPDPALEASWREYRRWRAARRRRRWAAAATGLVVVIIAAGFFWPSRVHHDTAAGRAALAHFNAPGRGGTIVVAPAKPLGTASLPAAPTEGERQAIATLTSPPAPTTPEEISLVPLQEPAAPSPSPTTEASGSATPPSDLAVPEPAETPLPSSKPKQVAGSLVDAPRHAAPPQDRAPHLQLASFRTEAKAQSALEMLRKEQHDLLGTLEARVQRAELADGRVMYRVLAGPLAGVAEAKRICAELQRRRLECRFVQ
jgi:hypothetical protein